MKYINQAILEGKIIDITVNSDNSKQVLYIENDDIFKILCSKDIMYNTGVDIRAVGSLTKLHGIVYLNADYIEEVKR